MTTKYCKISDVTSGQNLQILEEAGETIRRGGLVVFPTETVYGLGGDATSADSARAIYAAKGRPADNPLIIHIAKPEEATQFLRTNPVFDRLAARFMPGPLTVILPSLPSIPPEVRAGLDTVAVRCPSHPVANALIRAAGVPIAAPSANLSGKPSPTSAEDVRDDMDGRVDMILDGGECAVGLESTIVKVEDDGSLLLLRPGAVTLADLALVCDRVTVAPAVTAKLAEGEKVLSPGMKYRHYAPEAPVTLLGGNFDEMLAYLQTRDGKIAVIAYNEDIPVLRQALPGRDVYAFGAREDLTRQAHLLFHLLRDMDKKHYDAIYAPVPPKEGMGLALYNRMIRAAAHQIIIF